MPKPLTVWITIKLWKILQEMGIPDHLICLLRNLYAGQEAIVRTGHGTTDWFQIGKGVHQGCILSPCLFNLYAEYIMGEGNGTLLQYSCLENPMDGGAWWAAVHGVAKSRTWLGDFTFTFHFHALEKEMATHSSVLAWRIPGMGEPGGLPSMGLHRVGHDWSNLAAAAAAEYIMRNAGLEETQAGIKIAGRNIDNLRYADDTTLMAQNEEELKSLLMKVESEKVGLKLNIHKMKIWCHHFLGNRWGNSGNTVRLYFSGLQNHCRWWLQPWN